MRQSPAPITLIFLVAFVLGSVVSCAAAHVNRRPHPSEQREVEWPDESRDSKLWACFEDADRFVCLDFKRFLQYATESQESKTPRSEL